MNTKVLSVVIAISTILTLALHAGSMINGMSSIYSLFMSVSSAVGISSIVTLIVTDINKRNDLIASQA